VIWEDGKKSVEWCNKIAEGEAAPNQCALIRYGKKNSQKTWPARVLEVGKKLIQYVSCMVAAEIYSKGMMSIY